MEHSLRSRAAGRGALILPLLAFAGTVGVLPLNAWADTPVQRQELSAAVVILLLITLLINYLVHKSQDPADRVS